MQKIPGAVADPRATIVLNNARFSILTSRLIRMEWSQDGKFEDLASLVFSHRRQPVPEWCEREEHGWLIINTEHLSLRYRIDSGKFTPQDLEIKFLLNGQVQRWQPEQSNPGNLGGTVRTLDGISGAMPLDQGILSRDGWALIDDSERPLFDQAMWPWFRQRCPGERQDWYFFGYGHDFRAALADFVKIAGRIPMPPRYAFGLWWSRYWAYTDQELLQLADDFTRNDVPLDVLVVDMDWHQTFNLRWDAEPRDQSGHHLGWSGYSWDGVLFPDPKGFLRRLKAMGLKVTLNLHPASGVQPFETQYKQMAKAMGIDPATKKYVPFNITDKRFAENYMRILHYPLEEMGVDFWWLDWQQENETDIPGLHPIWALNYVHFTDMEWRGQRRPLIFHRWGGLGNHRYQIGFSGDTVSNWKSLAFQPHFTATAANVGYGYWSHDIGGHMPGKLHPELYLRWLQYGAFSPVLRTHTTKNAEAERRIWAFPAEYSELMRQAVKLRYTLIPYIYTAARKAYDSGISICRPMYYDWPENDEAYAFQQQYLFGDDLLISPICEPVSPFHHLVKKQVWLPEGEWFDWTKGKSVSGGRVLAQHYAIDEIPVFVRAGAIMPMQADRQRSDAQPLDPVRLKIFPGTRGQADLYEDHGDSPGYQKDECSWTQITQECKPDSSREMVISGSDGQFEGMLSCRAFELHLVDEWPPAAVFCNDNSIPFSPNPQEGSWQFDGDQLTTIIRLPRFSTGETIRVRIESSAELQRNRHLLDGVTGKMAGLRRIMPMLNSLWPKEWSPEVVVRAAQTGRRIALQPDTARSELEKFHTAEAEIVAAIAQLQVPQKRVLQKVIAHYQEQDAPVLPAWRNSQKKAAWSARADHKIVHFRDKMWLIGGQSEAGFCSDIWCSADGKKWQCVVERAPWAARAGHTCVMHLGQLYLIAGHNENGFLNDIWRTDDGTHWRPIITNAPFPARSRHACAGYGDKLYLIAGNGEAGELNDVWCTENGEDWQQLTSRAGWHARAGHAVIEHDGLMWLSGGQGQATFADLWCSADGKRWRQVSDGQYMLPRTGHALVASEERLWILGGQSPDWHCYLNDIWCSENGVDWHQASDDAAWSVRRGMAAFVLNGDLHLLGGQSLSQTVKGKKTAFENDIWLWPLDEAAARLNEIMHRDA